MLFVVLLMRTRNFSFAIVFFFFILIKSFHLSLFWNLSIVVLTTTRSFFFALMINLFIESFNLLLCQEHASSIYSLLYARLFFRRSLTRSIFELMKYWKEIFFDWILIFSRRDLFLREMRLKKTRSWARPNKNLSSIFKSSIFLFFSIFAILFVDVFFFESAWTRFWELSESC
jgi:hypothetical protein